jgi:hypothetical protein
VPGTEFLAIVAYVIVAVGMAARAMTATHGGRPRSGSSSSSPQAPSYLS